MFGGIRKLIKEKAWRWFGNAGHFCGASNCRFHLCTEVGGYLVSTVGEWYPDNNETMRTLGASAISFYETYVFKTTDARCVCGCGLPEIDLSEVEGIRYSKAKEANEGHIKLCEKYQSL